MKNWRAWLHKLLGAFIGGFALVFAGAAAIEQVKKDSEPIHWKQLMDTSALAGAGAAAAYLMKSPLPPEEEPKKPNDPENKN